MHELPVTEGILKTVLPSADKAGAERILEIRLKIGALSGVEPVCLQEYLDMIAQGTKAEGAKIVTETVPAQIRCSQCAYEGVTSVNRSVCPSCGGREFTVTGGWDVSVTELVVE